MLLRNCRLIPELSGNPNFTMADVAVEGDMIQSVAPAGAGLAAESVYDCQGHTLMPGLFDLHAHISIASAREEPLDAMENLLQAMAWFGGYLKHGVTTIRDCGSSNRMAIPLRDAVKRGAVLGPDVVACGYMLGPQSMYQLGREMTMTMSIVDGADAFRAAAHRELSLGADFVKIYASASGSQGLTKDSAPILTSGEVRAAVEAAKAGGAYVAAHAHSLPAIRMCMEEGVRCIEHATFLDPAAADELAQMRGVYLVPTFAVLTPPDDGSRSPEELAAKEELLHTAAANIRYAYEKGLSMGFGTDLINGRLEHFYKEFFYRHTLCGMSPVDILLQATKYSAEIAGLSGVKGEIRPGMAADMILVDGEPDKTLRVLEQPPICVWKRGTIVFSTGGDI